MVKVVNPQFLKRAPKNAANDYSGRFQTVRVLSGIVARVLPGVRRPRTPAVWVVLASLTRGM